MATANSFGEALEQLIEGVAEIAAAIMCYVFLDYHDISDKARHQLLRQALTPGGATVVAGLNITFRRYGAEIVLWSREGRNREWQARFLADVGRLEAGFYGPRDHDRRVSVTVGLPTLIALSRGIDPEMPESEAAAEALAADRAGSDSSDSSEGAS